MTPVKDDRRIPEATVARLTVYLRSLLQATDRSSKTISSGMLGELAGVDAAKVRKDLSYIGTSGTRGVGYDIDALFSQIRRRLGLDQERTVAIVGIGNLGRALANYDGFSPRGLRIVGLFDSNRAKVGECLGGIAVRPMSDLAAVVAEERVAIGVITTPAGVAQDVANRLVAAGVSSVLNFAPTVVVVPDHVALRKVDLSIELQILSYYQQRAAPASS
jgi:redox-sensing transcriptional repressor